MFFQILKIILWPKNKKLVARTLEFKTNSINYITGASKTGKSAIIPIIDYCLGSEKCAIPVKTIRDNCEWFGLLIQTKEGEKLLARKEPGEYKATGDMFILEGIKVEIPPIIEKNNTTVDDIKEILNGLAGLTNLDFGYYINCEMYADSNTQDVRKRVFHA